MYAAGLSTGPPPGLGLPHPTFWGMGWRRVGWLFIRWNIYGYAFLVGSLLACARRKRTRAEFRKVAFWCMAIYGVGLLPYLATGALTHGWAGGYVHQGCERRIEVLNTALVEYAKQHGGRLPTVDGFDVLLQELGPYLTNERLGYGVPVHTCPAGAAYLRDPKRYVWDTQYSGAELQDTDWYEVAADQVPIACPYHQRPGYRVLRVLQDYTSEMDEKGDPVPGPTP